MKIVNETQLLVIFSMLAFSANSLLCRIALKLALIDPGTFTAVRLISGAITLWFVVLFRKNKHETKGSWGGALALFIYAAGFSYAYVQLSTGTGALVLFTTVQITMIGYGLIMGERLSGMKGVGFILAFIGLVALLLPKLQSPSLASAGLMIGAGMAWGYYSLLGQRQGDPTLATAGNFLRAVPFALILLALRRDEVVFSSNGIILAIVTGAVTSGIGYAVWYAVLPRLLAMHAATFQLSVPVLATIGGVALLGEPFGAYAAICSATILAGIAIVIGIRKRDR